MRKWLQHISNRTARRLTLLLAAAGVLLLGTAVWLTLSMEEEPATLTTFAMGSYVQQTVYGSQGEEAAQAASTAVTELENQISWRVEDSDIAFLNQEAGKDFQEIDSQTWEILQTALQVCQQSGGAFDVTIAPLSWLWNFDENPHLPEADTIAAFLPQVNWENVLLGEDNTAALKTSSTALDLGAVGKGAACDAAVAVYQESGVDRAVVAVGGSIGLWGEKPFEDPWRVALRDPATDGSLGELALQGGFVSTSGSYEKQFEEDGTTYHHILDPDTGYPAQSGLVSVTVWSSSGVLSDALSTACFVLGLEDSLPLLEEFASGAVFVTEDNQVYVTENLQDAFSLTAQDYTLAGTL